LHSQAGSISLAWDAVPNASGYKVYYGTVSGQYTNTITTPTPSAIISGLQDCTTYFAAVKAYNGAGESPNFSNELSGWSRPGVTSATPSSAMQGDQVVMDIVGANFQSGAIVDLANPHISLSSVTVLSCTHIQLLATVEPTAANARAAEVGKLDVTVANPDDVFGMRSQGFEVLINPARFDINKSDAVTANRLDGKDMVWLSRHFAKAETDPNYDPDHDFDGDGWVDGADLAMIASNLGRCWSSPGKTWLASACPANLQ
jgi:hypothetical protein